jgi:hypothetical protein
MHTFPCLQRYRPFLEETALDSAHAPATSHGYAPGFLCFIPWKCFLPITLPALFAGLLGFDLMDALPPDKGIPAAVMLAALVAVIGWQWWRTEDLRERLAALEEWRDDEQTEYYYLDEDGEEKLCDD